MYYYMCPETVADVRGVNSDNIYDINMLYCFAGNKPIDIR